MILYEEKINKMIYSVLDVKKQITRLSYKEEELQRYLFTIDEINSLDRLTFTYGETNSPLTEWEIPSIFEGFIYPSEVTLTGDRKEIDVLIRPFDYISDTVEVSKTDNKGNKILPMTKLEFNNFSDLIAGPFKGTVSIDKICKTALTIADAVKDVEKDGFVQQSPLTRAPFEMSVQLVRDSAYSIETIEAFGDYLREKFSAKAKCVRS